MGESRLSVGSMAASTCKALPLGEGSSMFGRSTASYMKASIHELDLDLDLDLEEHDIDMEGEYTCRTVRETTGRRRTMPVL